MLIRQTAEFDRWFARLRDQRARAKVEMRLRRLSLGHLGDIKPIGEGLSELRIDYGPGYRIYIAWSGTSLVIVLAGGDKGSQARDIATAKRLASALRDNE